MAPSPSPSHDTAARPLGLATLLEVVRRRRILAVTPLLLIAAATLSLAFFLPRLWTAQARILVDRPQVPETMVKSTVSTDLESRLLTINREILTTERLETIIKESNLYPGLRRTRPMDEVAEAMRKDIRIDFVEDDRRRDARSAAFTVAYTAPDPRLAAAVTNTLASLYVEEKSRLRERQAAGTSTFLDGQLAEVRGKLAQQEQKIAEYKERYLGELPEQRDANLRALEQLQARMQFAQENNRRANERRQLLSGSLGELDQTAGRADTGWSPTPAQSAAARAKLLRQEQKQLQARYGEGHPSVQAMEEQIRALEAKASAPAPKRAVPPPRDTARRAPPDNPYVAGLMTQLDQASVEARATADEIAGLNRQVAYYTRRLENTPRREQELAVITRDYETTKQLFHSLLGKRSEADIAIDLEHRQKGEQFRVLEAASVPPAPAGPNRLRLVMMGLLLAVGASVGALVLAENLDTSYRRPDEVRATVPVPLISTIPRIATERDRRYAGRRRRLATAAVGLGLVAVVGSSFAIAHDNQALVRVLTPEPGKR